MKVINELAASLNQQFNWNKSRMNCFVRMLIGLISVRSVNLQEIATAFDSEATINTITNSHLEVKWVYLCTQQFSLLQNCLASAGWHGNFDFLANIFF